MPLHPTYNPINVPAFSLETRMEADQEGMIGSLLKHMFFCLDPVNVLYKKKKALVTQHSTNRIKYQ